MGQTLVERMKDVDTERVLDRDADLRREETPSSPSRRNLERLKTWKPPESVRIGPSHAMNRWSPPMSRTSSWPGRNSK